MFSVHSDCIHCRGLVHARNAFQFPFKHYLKALFSYPHPWARSEILKTLVFACLVSSFSSTCLFLFLICAAQSQKIVIGFLAVIVWYKKRYLIFTKNLLIITDTESCLEHLHHRFLMHKYVQFCLNYTVFCFDKLLKVTWKFCWL